MILLALPQVFLANQPNLGTACQRFPEIHRVSRARAGTVRGATCIIAALCRAHGALAAHCALCHGTGVWLRASSAPKRMSSGQQFNRQ